MLNALVGEELPDIVSNSHVNLLCVSVLRFLPDRTKLTNRLDHVVKFLVAHAGVKTDPKRRIHYRVGVDKRTDDAIVDSFLQRLAARMLRDVSRKEITRLDVL